MAVKTIREPTLAAKEPNIPKLLAKLRGRYPYWLSPKIDGIRGFVENRVVLARSRKPIPNRFIQSELGKAKYEGLDGELCVGKPWDFNLMQQTSSGTRSADGEPDFKFYVFDRWNSDEFFPERNESLRAVEGGRIVRVPHILVTNEAELLAFEEKCLLRGYEGIMGRLGDFPYMDKRSTWTDPFLFAMKRREDSEATILEVHEKMHNTNEATKNELGRTQRLGGKKNNIGLGTFGSATCIWPETGATFNAGNGPGLTDAERARLWAMRDKLPGRSIKFSFVRIGMKNGIPRQPQIVALRDEFDL